MQTQAVAALLIALCVTHANAQSVLDRAAKALGGADALQKQNRLLFSQHEIETGLVRDNATLIKGGDGTLYNHRAASFRSFPSPPSIPP